MFVKAIMSQASTDKDYKKVLNQRIHLLYIVFVLGVITLGVCALFSIGKYAYLSSFISGVYSGVGGGLIAISIINIFKIKRTLKDKEKLREKRIEEQDERNQMIIQKSIYSATVLLMIVSYIGLMIAGIFNLIIFWTLWVVFMLYMISFVLSTIYYKKKL